MKSNIHPRWYPDARIICACGSAFTIGTSKKEIHVEVCSRCHPFYTGETETRYIDTQRRVTRFQKLQKIASEKRAMRERAHQAKKEVRPRIARSIKEMIREEQQKSPS